MWSNYIMDFLLLLANFGKEISEDSNATVVDFNGNGMIDMFDFLQMLGNQPPL